MAIEFSCPQCAAVIRVPDVASGKKGSCPTCQTKLIVPTIEVPDPAEQIAQISSPEPPPPIAPPTAPLFPSEPAAPQFSSEPIPQVQAPQTPAPFDPFALPSDAPAEPQVSAPVTPPAETPLAEAPAPAVDESGVPTAPAWMKPQVAPQASDDVLFPSAPTSSANPASGQPDLGFLNAAEGGGPAAGIVPPANPDQPGVTTNRPSSMAARVRRRTKSKKSGIVFALLCGVGLVGIVGYMYVMQGPSIEGTRRGIMLLGGKMIPKTLSKELIDVSPEVLETVLTDFAEDPQGRRLSSQLVTTAFRGTLEGLEVTITTGTESKFVQFPIDANLRKYYDSHLEELGKARDKDLAAMAKKFFEKWDVAIRNSEGVEDFAQYRDVGLNTCRGALGYNVSAKVGRGLYPCVYEDEGNLYFAVPPKTKRFTVVGIYTNTNKKSKFPGKYDVIVIQQKKPTPKP
jgi:hypothetical protein